MEIYEKLGKIISPEIVYDETIRGDYIFAGNSGFRIVRSKGKSVWKWHFIPEGKDTPPEDKPTREKYRKMFIFGFYALIQELKNSNKQIPKDLTAHTNYSMADFLKRIFQENVEVIKLTDNEAFTSIYLDDILTNEDLLNNLKQTYLEVLNNPFTLNLNEQN